MKGCNVIGALTVAASLLFFSTAAYGWYAQWEALDWDKDEQESGEGTHWAEADYEDFCLAHALAVIEYPQENTWGGAYAYVDGKYYIVGYDPEEDPPLTAYVSCGCESTVIASWMVDESDYLIKAAAQGYAGPYSAYAYVEVTEPDEGDVDTDAFYRKEIDVSYNGATVYVGEIAFAQAEAYYTESKVGVYAYAESNVDCDVEEDP